MNTISMSDLSSWHYLCPTCGVEVTPVEDAASLAYRGNPLTCSAGHKFSPDGLTLCSRPLTVDASGTYVPAYAFKDGVARFTGLEKRNATPAELVPGIPDAELADEFIREKTAVASGETSHKTTDAEEDAAFDPSRCAAYIPGGGFISLPYGWTLGLAFTDKTADVPSGFAVAPPIPPISFSPTDDETSREITDAFDATGYAAGLLSYYLLRGTLCERESRRPEVVALAGLDMALTTVRSVLGRTASLRFACEIDKLGRYARDALAMHRAQTEAEANRGGK